MFFEVPFVLIVSIVACVIVFKIKAIEYTQNKDIPLPELAEKLLSELEVINKLPVDVRKNKKKEWNEKFNSYLERKKLEKPELASSPVKLRAIK